MALATDIETEAAMAHLSEPDLHPSALTRRRFLQALGAGVAVSAMPSILQQGMAWAAGPLGPTENVLLLVNLQGGNDPLNTLVPHTSGAYRSARGAIAIPSNQVLPVTSNLGLHPSLATTKTWWDRGNLAFVQGIGWPGNTLSHFDSTAIWMSGRAGNSVISTTGWVGRYLDGLTNPSELLHSVHLSTELPLQSRGVVGKAAALPPAPGALFAAGLTSSAFVRMSGALQTMASQHRTAPYADLITATAADALGLRDDLTDVMRLATGTGFSNDLATAARLINSNIGIRVVSAELAGFDTHDNQLSDQADLLAQVDAAIASFYATLDPAWFNRVTIVIWTEFGRRVALNSGNGTDHGAAGLAMVLGGKVKGGFYGTAPSLTSLDSRGNQIPNVDFRSLWATMLDQWLAADSRSILGATYEQLALFNAAGSTPVTPPVVPPVTPPAPPPTVTSVLDTGGYWVVTDRGQVRAFGNRAAFGDGPTGVAIAAMASSATKRGYWLVGRDGSIHPRGDAPNLGTLGGMRLNSPIVDMTTTASGNGFWLLGQDGGIFSFGDAPFYGSTGNLRLAKPVVAMSAVPGGGGYWFVASDGGVFCYGPRALFFGSTGGVRLVKPVVGMAPTPTGKGYWLVASDGGIFCFGDALFFGSTGAVRLVSPIIGMRPTPSGKGYWLVAADGGVFCFGDATFFGSLGGQGLTATSMAS